MSTYVAVCPYLTQFNMTPLMCAAYSGHTSIVLLLLSKGADYMFQKQCELPDRGGSGGVVLSVVSSMQEGKTACDLACENGHEQICEQP